MASSVFVAGHRGLVGAAIHRRLTHSTEWDVITCSRSQLDLRDFEQTRRYLDKHRPDAVIVAAGVVGGIQANRTRPVEFLSDNALIALNLINASFAAEVERLVYLSSNCIYPKFASPPYRVEMIGQGAMEPTNEGYGTAKLLGMKLCDSYNQQYGVNYVSVIPTNTFGPGDSLEESAGHVISDLLMKSLRLSDRRVHTKVLQLWGTGTPLREFLFVDDLADAIVFVLDRYAGHSPVNIGGGELLSIRQLAERITATIDPSIQIVLDDSLPDGAPARFLDNSVLTDLGWKPAIGFDEGLLRTIDWYRRQMSL